MKKSIAALAAGALLLCGCASTTPTPVSEEEAPTELLKTLAGLNSDSKAQDVLDALNTLIDETGKAYEYHFYMDQTTEASNASVQDNTLTAVTSSSRTVDIRYGTDTCVYELLEQKSGDQQMAGLMDANAKGTTTVYAEYKTGGIGQENSTLSIESLDSTEDAKEYKEDELKSVVQNTVLYPLYPFIGASLILQPFAQPNYYDFSLGKLNNDYIFTMQIHDAEEYNEALDTYVSEYMGYDRTDLNGDGSFILDSYDTQEVTIKVTMDENGVIKKIENNTFNVLSAGETSIDVYSKQTLNLSQAAEENGTFFKDFFEQIQQKELKQGDTFSLSVSR